MQNTNYKFSIDTNYYGWLKQILCYLQVYDNNLYNQIKQKCFEYGTFLNKLFPKDILKIKKISDFNNKYLKYKLKYLRLKNKQ